MKKYVQVGCGARGRTYAIPLIEEYSDCAELAGLYDTNPKRAELIAAYAREKHGRVVPVYDDFDAMIEAVRPDAVIVTTPDCYHELYAIRAMRAGCDVICEKPLTTTFEKALEIRRVQKETEREVTVTFNCRFNPFFRRVKEYVRSGVIGEVLSVHFEWLLDTVHGADYFRRWHRERKNSGSLLVHKSTHHFDLVNWFLEEDPLEVNAFGTRRFYGPKREKRGERCLTCPHKSSCEFYMDITHGLNAELYLNCEDADGYLRDKCVFSEEIDIEDSVSVNVRYSGGAIMSYSLTAHSPWEGINLVFNGTKGRMEVKTRSESTPFYDERNDRSITIYNREGEKISIEIPQKTTAGHGGADKQIRDRLFRNPGAPDPLSQLADTRAGLMSIGIGMAANLSMKEGRRVALSEFYDE